LTTVTLGSSRTVRLWTDTPERSRLSTPIRAPPSVRERDSTRAPPSERPCALMPWPDEPGDEPWACVAPEPEPRLSLDTLEPPEDEPPEPDEPELALVPAPDDPELPPAPPGLLEVWASAAVPMSAAASPKATIFMSVSSVPWER
jgi:hypothetical protein